MEWIISISIGLLLGFVISRLTTPKGDSPEVIALKAQLQSDIAKAKEEAHLALEEKERAFKDTAEQEDRVRREAFKEREDRLIQREKTVDSCTKRCCK